MIRAIIKSIKLSLIRNFTATYCSDCIYCSDKENVTKVDCLESPISASPEFLSKEADRVEASQKRYYSCRAVRRKDANCVKYIPIGWKE